jgi:hypothetical protein
MTTLLEASTLTCSRVKPRLTNSRTSFSPKLSVGRIKMDGSRGIEHRLLLLLPLLAAPAVMVRNEKQYYSERQDISDYKVTGLASLTNPSTHRSKITRHYEPDSRLFWRARAKSLSSASRTDRPITSSSLWIDRRAHSGSSLSDKNGVSVSVVPIRRTFFFRSIEHCEQCAVSLTELSYTFSVRPLHIMFTISEG